MRIGKTEPTKIVVSITLQRPARPGEKNNRDKPYKDGQSVRETFESVDVYDAKPEEVKEVVLRALLSASNSKK